MTSLPFSKSNTSAGHQTHGHGVCQSRRMLRPRASLDQSVPVVRGPRKLKRPAGQIPLQIAQTLSNIDTVRPDRKFEKFIEIECMLAASDLSWRDLASALQVEADSNSVSEMVKVCKARLDHLDPQSRKFVESLSADPVLSAKQRIWLKGLYIKVRGYATTSAPPIPQIPGTTTEAAHE